MIWHAELLPELLGFNTSSTGFTVLKMLQEHTFLRSHALDQVVVSACSVQHGRQQPGLRPAHTAVAFTFFIH